MTRLAVSSWVAVVGLLISSAAIGESLGIVADFVMTQSRPVGDDNSIERAVLGEFAQDSEGRTRFRLDNMLLIADPVEGRSWRVDTAKRVAFEQRHDPVAPPPRDGGDIHSESWIGEFSLPQRDLPQFDEQNLETAELGIAMVNGVECTGRRWTYSIPAGTIGNVDPIEIVTETWMSEKYGFQLPVKTVTRSALSGARTRELRHIRETNFDRGYFRPEASLKIEVVER